MYRKFLLTVVMLAATVVGWMKGDEAKQKWVYKWKTTYNEKRQLAKKRLAQRKGLIMLDEIELSAFHNG